MFVIIILTLVLNLNTKLFALDVGDQDFSQRSVHHIDLSNSLIADDEIIKILTYTSAITIKDVCRHIRKQIRMVEGSDSFFYINMSHNSIADEGVRFLVSKIKKYNIVGLDLSHNSITDFGVFTLISSFIDRIKSDPQFTMVISDNFGANDPNITRIIEAFSLQDYQSRIVHK